MNQNQMEQLLPLVAELTEKYTGFESTSITYEKAQMLMQAVCYCLQEFEQSHSDSLAVKDLSVKEKYELGQQLVVNKAAQVAEQMNELSGWFDDYGVLCLYETVQTAVPEFLKRYDARFCPQDTLIMLDYPLLTDRQQTGVDAVYEYMNGIQIEQRFLRRFDRTYIIQVLERYDASYREMIDNICEIVLVDTIWHMVMQKPFAEAGYMEEALQQLADSFSGRSVEEITGVIRQMIGEMVKRHYEGDKEMEAYLCTCAGSIAARIFCRN